MISPQLDPSRVLDGEAAQPTVLLVEDDDALRYAAARHLAQSGLRVTAVKDCLQALSVVERGALPDCLVVDIHMPPGSPHGAALANMLQLRKPDQLVIFVTGFAEAAADTRELWGADSVFTKPVDFRKTGGWDQSKDPSRGAALIPRLRLLEKSLASNFGKVAACKGWGRESVNGFTSFQEPLHPCAVFGAMKENCGRDREN